MSKGHLKKSLDLFFKGQWAQLIAQQSDVTRSCVHQHPAKTSGGCSDLERRAARAELAALGRTMLEMCTTYLTEKVATKVILALQSRHPSFISTGDLFRECEQFFAFRNVFARICGNTQLWDRNGTTPIARISPKLPGPRCSRMARLNATMSLPLKKGRLGLRSAVRSREAAHSLGKLGVSEEGPACFSRVNALRHRPMQVVCRPRIG